MALSRANCARRVPSRNQRRTSTACLKQPSARVPARVPRRWRSACNRPETNSTVSSRTLNVAVYVTLILTRNPYEVDLWKDHLHTGVLRLLVAPQRLRRVERPPPAVNYRTSPPPCAEWLIA